jgi:hypothetical protein
MTHAKHEIAVFIENEEMLKEARGLLDKYGEKEWGHELAFDLDYGCNYLAYDDNLDDDGWYTTASMDNITITLPQLEEILKNQ